MPGGIDTLLRPNHRKQTPIREAARAGHKEALMLLLRALNNSTMTTDLNELRMTWEGIHFTLPPKKAI